MSYSILEDKGGPLMLILMNCVCSGLKNWPKSVDHI